jgi:hypothetical protein
MSTHAAYTQRIVGTGETIREHDLVEFWLLYEGQLVSSGGTNSRAPEKHEIRRSFHPQLRRLWHVKSGLRQLAEMQGHVDVKDGKVTTTPEERFQRGLRAIGEKWERNGYQLVPLVTSDMALRCSLDILLLRPEEGRFIFTSGDIDGQVKTLFDALRIPANLSEAGGIGPQQDETPFFCLLEDDRLISEVRVNADQLLLLPHDREIKGNTCFVTIHVKLNHKNPRAFDNYFD